MISFLWPGQGQCCPTILMNGVNKILVKSKKSHNTEWIKWLLLQPKGGELKRLIEKQRRIEFKHLIEWDGGTNFPWHPQGTHTLLRQRNIPVKRKQQKGRRTVR